MSYPYFRQQTHKVSFLEDCDFSAMLYPAERRWFLFSDGKSFQDY